MVVIFQPKATFSLLIPIKIRSINKMKSLGKMLGWFISNFCFLRNQGPKKGDIGARGVSLVYLAGQDCGVARPSSVKYNSLSSSFASRSQDPKWMLETTDVLNPE